MDAGQVRIANVTKEWVEWQEKEWLKELTAPPINLDDLVFDLDSPGQGKDLKGGATSITAV